MIAHGKSGPVKGLTKSDFVLYDNGKKRDIAVFEMNCRQSPAAGAETSLAPNEFTNQPTGTVAEQGNAILVVWDMLNTGFQDQIRARPAVIQNLKTIRPGDHVGLYILGKRIGVLQEFTSDSSQLIAAMDRFAKWPDTGYYPLQQQKDEVLRRAEWEILNHLARVPGRKSVIWISSGGPRLLFGAGFAVYPVDARALPGFNEIQAEHSSAGDLTNTSWGPHSRDRDAMRAAAESTGGAFATWSNDIRGALDQALTDADLTYTLAFYADAPRPGEKPYRTLKVQPKRSGVDLRFRKSYQTNPYSPPAARLISDAVASAIDSTQIAIGARLERDGSALRIPVTIGAADLMLGQTGSHRTGSLDLMLLQRSAAEGVLDSLSRAVELDFDGPRYEAFLKQGFRGTFNMDAKPGLAEIKIVAFDRSSKHVGSLTIPIAP
ncbi:MAG: VWA domain-containing protein [Acidobacteriia bacterium]|nr:VWA domain-containing protein [Terriglobia bacterium]